MTGFGAEASYIEELLAAFPGRIPDAGAFALRYRVLLLDGPLGIPADIALGALPFEQRCTERATPFAIGGDQTILTCSADDLVVLKAFAGRPRDWLDIEGIALRQGASMNQRQILDEVTPLLALKEDEVSGQVEALRGRVFSRAIRRHLSRSRRHGGRTSAARAGRAGCSTGWHCRGPSRSRSGRRLREGSPAPIDRRGAAC